MAKILVFAGSARKDSFNKKLAREAARYLEETGATVTFIDLKDFEMPIYDGDLEDASGLPEAAKRLKKLFIEHDGFVIASPEYNSSIAPLLKNSLDWISRVETKEEKALVAYRGKAAALVAASPGGLGGLRGLVPLRLMLSNIGVWVAPDQLAVSAAHQAFGDDGQLTNPQQVNQLKSVVKQLVDYIDG